MNDRQDNVLSDEAAIAWLLWQAEMGADEAIGETPIDYFAQSPVTGVEPQPARPALRGRTDPAPPRVAPRPTPAAQPRGAQGSNAATLEALRDALMAFDGCGLKRTATNLCFYRGAAQARLMLIGEAPGRDEDLSGKPFVGRAGQLLDRMLAAIGIGDSAVHITNIVYWRPPGNRNPAPDEVEACRPFLTRQIELVAPDAILSLGGPAAKALTGSADGIMKLRGRWRKIEVAGREIPLLPTLHPAYLLRTPAAKRLAWRDLLALQQFVRAGQEDVQSHACQGRTRT